MPWKEVSTLSLRSQFVALARRFEISRKTAYKWLPRAVPGEP